MTEIERKFLVDDLPSFVDIEHGETIRQAYIAVEGTTEVRIRSRAGRCTLTVKSGHGLERGEVEVTIDLATFDALWALVEHDHTIDKVRCEIDLTDGARPVVAELDVYRGRLTGLIVVEVEFERREDADAFEPPTWFGAEVTGDVAWSNAALARGDTPGRNH